MTDEGKAGIAMTLWALAFTAGEFIAAFKDKPFGLTLMVVSSLVLAIYLKADGRIEAERKRRKRYEDDCARREREVRR